MTADWLLRCARHGYQVGSERLYHPGGVVEDNAALVKAAGRNESKETAAESTVIKAASDPLSLSRNTSSRCTTPSKDGQSGENARGAVGKEKQQTAKPEAEAHLTEHSAPRTPDIDTPIKISKPSNAVLMQPTDGAEIASHHQSSIGKENVGLLKTIPKDVPKEDTSIDKGRGVNVVVPSDTKAVEDHAPVTSELERQLRSMLSASEGGSAGATGASSSPDGLEASAFHRRLRLNARGVRPAPFSSNITPNAVTEPAVEGGVSSRSTARETESDLKLLSCRTSSDGQGAREEEFSVAPVSSVAALARHSGGNTLHGKADEIGEEPMKSIANGTCKRKTGVLDGGDRKRHADLTKMFVARSRQRVGRGDRGCSALSSVVTGRDEDRRMKWSRPPLAVARQRSAAKDHIRWEGQENDPLLCRGLVRLCCTFL